MASESGKSWWSTLRSNNDLLMLVAKLLIIVMRIGLIVAMLAAAIGTITSSIVLFDTLDGRVLPVGIWWPHGPVPVAAALAMVAIAVLSIALLGLLNAFLEKLSALMDTLSLGDPFAPNNARRLQMMGLFAFAVQALATTISLLAAQIGPGYVQNIYLSPHLSLSPAGLIFVLTLFILARIFLRGTQMRDALEARV